MNKFLAFIFGDSKSDNYNNMEYYYDLIEEYSDDATCYKKHDKNYKDDCFDGGESSNEDDYCLYKASDIFDLQ